MSETNKKQDCPRCLGKGFVNESDIKRLKRYIEWTAGLCGYCGGLGKVNPNNCKNVEVNDIYLHSDLSREERDKYFNQESDSVEKAREYKASVDSTILSIEKLCFEEEKTLDEVVLLFQTFSELNQNEIENLKGFVSRIIEQNQK